MQSFNDDDRDGAASPPASSDNEADETMEDVDDNEGNGDGDAEAEGEVDGDNEEDNDDNENDEEGDEDNQDPFSDSPTQARASLPNPTEGSAQSPGQQTALPSSQDPAVTNGSSSAGPTSQLNPSVLLTSPTPHPRTPTPAPTPTYRPSVRPEAISAPVYDIVPTIAAPHSTSINAITATPDLRWVFSGGADGYIRRFNWIDTANGKAMLTVAQRHPFVDSVVKAGVLMSYWENEEPQVKSPLLQPSDDNTSLSPVYSLAVNSQALWLLSGLDSGGINLQSVRHDEGKRITCLRKHTSAVSVLKLAQDEKSVLSGSWDKNVYDWDLNTGQVKRDFIASGGQISALEGRPLSSLPVPPESVELATANGTLSTNNEDQPLTNGALINGAAAGDTSAPLVDGVQNEDAAGSPADSLFGGNDGDSLFGDNEEDSGAVAPSGGNFGDDDDDEFSRAIANGLQQQTSQDADGDVSMTNGEPPSAQQTRNDPIQPQAHSPPKDDAKSPNAANGIKSPPSALTNGLPHFEEDQKANAEALRTGVEPQQDSSLTSDTTFLAASFDGTLRVWDRRQSNPVATIMPRNTPPWCMNACWSPDGNYIYAGRRNGTVEEFSLHKGLRNAHRTFRFPQGSGPVSAVKAMPNGRHLICASFDILRLYDLREQQAFKHATVPFLIVPGHRGGVISSLYIDPTCSYLLSTAGNRGWEGSTTEVMLGYDISVGQ
ncbi:MAG: Transcription factor spt8 [Piccolia ochrophora]|nr:MAG: Transcription factor spt8 [Piccolia ochrophora]